MLDTVKLFHLPHQRNIKLRYLAGYFLGKDIQVTHNGPQPSLLPPSSPTHCWVGTHLAQGTVHDSIEDADTALQLALKYKELQASGKLTAVLHDLYTQGRMSNWKAQLKKQ